MFNSNSSNEPGSPLFSVEPFPCPGWKTHSGRVPGVWTSFGRVLLWPMRFATHISRRGDSRIAHTYLPEGDLRIAHPFKGGIVWRRVQVPKGRLSHSRAILCPEQTVGADVGHWGIRPSLRDLCNRSCEPGSQLPGYSRISLRETKAANRSKLQSAWRDEKKVFIRCGPIPLKTAGNHELPYGCFCCNGS